jgi:hypothetical protein
VKKSGSHEKTRGQVGTTGTASIHAGFRRPPLPGTLRGQVGTNRIRKILRIELLASYVHEIAHSAVALHYGGLFVPSLSPVVPATFFPVGTLESQYPCGVPICPRCPREKHGEVK